jgi:hypothetical protein
MTASTDPVFTIRRHPTTGRTAVRSDRNSPLPWTALDTGQFLQHWYVEDWTVIGGPNNFEETR